MKLDEFDKEVREGLRVFNEGLRQASEGLTLASILEVIDFSNPPVSEFDILGFKSGDALQFKIFKGQYSIILGKNGLSFRGDYTNSADLRGKVRKNFEGEEVSKAYDRLAGYIMEVQPEVRRRAETRNDRYG